MTTYLVRRSLQSLLILFLISIVMYGILNLDPKGPYAEVYAVQYNNPQQMQAAIARAERRLGLDDSLPMRYILWLYNWRPADENDAEFLTIQLQNYQDEAKTVTDPDRLKFVQQQLHNLPLQIADVNAKLAACGDLFNLDSLGQCLSLKRVGGILTANLGTSWKIAQGEPVLALISGSEVESGQDPTSFATVYGPSSVLHGPLANTLVLIFFSILLALLLAIPIGIYSAVKQYSVGDYVFSFISFVGLGLPSFCLGTLLILAERKGWLFGLPIGGVVNNPDDVSQYSDVGIRLSHLIAPGFVLGFALMAGFSRFIRSSMLEVLHLDYVRTAWAKGLKQRTVIFKHAMRNALIPLVTRIALAVPALLGGVVIVDSITNYPGIGGLLFRAGGLDDWPVLMGLLIVGAILVVLSNVLADVAYAVIDPRIRYS